MAVEEDRGLSIEIIENTDVSPDMDRKIRDGLVECFPKDEAHYSKDRVWHSSEPSWIALALTADGGIAAHIAVVERTVTAGKDGESPIPVAVFGPGGVFARPQWRKTGLIERLMRHVTEESYKRGLQAGLLFCKEVLAGKVYCPMGWEKANGTTFMEDAHSAIIPRPDKDITMTIPLSMDVFPPGDIGLNGPDW